LLVVGNNREHRILVIGVELWKDLPKVSAIINDYASFSTLGYSHGESVWIERWRDNDRGNRAAGHQQDARITEHLSNSLRVESPKM